MQSKYINDVILLGRWSDRHGPEGVLTSTGLAWTAIDDCETLARHAATGAPAAAVILAAGTTAAEREQWLAVLRAAGGLWSSTPLIEWSADGAGGDLVAALAQWLGPLAEPTFRDPDWPVYRLVRLVGFDRAEGLLSGLATVLREALAQAATGPVDLGTAHRLAGLCGLYGFADLGQRWQEYETGESPDAAAAVAATRQVLERLER